jgi:hypothetical protein
MSESPTTNNQDLIDAAREAVAIESKAWTDSRHPEEAG